MFKTINNKIVLLVNTEYEVKYFNNVGCDVIYCNNNAFVDENIFNIYDNITKEYDLIINSCFAKYKNTFIANKCNNVAHIGYYNSAVKKQHQIVPNFGTIINYKNSSDYKVLNYEEIAQNLNKSLVGGIFSSEEGGCFASTEYLLCGLPVISINSIGGRDIWYNSDNSIICDNNEDSVSSTLEIIKQKISNKEFNSYSIRENCLKKMNYFRDILTEYIINYINKIPNNKIEPSFDELKKLLLHFTK